MERHLADDLVILASIAPGANVEIVGADASPGDRAKFA